MYRLKTRLTVSGTELKVNYASVSTVITVGTICPHYPLFSGSSLNVIAMKHRWTRNKIIAGIQGLASKTDNRELVSPLMSELINIGICKVHIFFALGDGGISTEYNDPRCFFPQHLNRTHSSRVRIFGVEKIIGRIAKAVLSTSAASFVAECFSHDQKLRHSHAVNLVSTYVVLRCFYAPWVYKKKHAYSVSGGALSVDLS